MTEPTALDKARGAMAEAKRIQGDSGELLIGVKHEEWRDLLSVASVQANIAQAAALERIAECLERRTVTDPLLGRI